MKKDVELYCLIDGDGEQAGMISTDAPQGKVEELWKMVNSSDDMPDELWAIIMSADADDEAETEQLVLLLEYDTYTVERVWYTEVTA